ncbi:MAG: NAD(P)/FAD-dependent oxidoreductase [Xanthomonadaceae bacterium]|jgi:cation diffusion facilitator CzcD-associated flavoprotein CzcO|nr:NAD(P)/FAD-dependent oxidoreductase [Xanthomonadaceae bacterium]
MDSPHESRHRVVVLGAGMSGLCMGIRLKRGGIDDFVIVEKQPGLGGTWWDTRYPGAQVDVPAPAYAFSFAPNPDWSRRFADAAEIQSYQQALAGREGLLPHLRLGETLVEACWDEAAAEWRLRTAAGATLHARWLVCSTGPLSPPRWPDLPGLDRFAGPRLHSARWDDAVPIEGRRVGVIGTGSSAAQLVPPLARKAARLVVFQRSANWVLPRLDRRYHALDRWLARRPAYARLVRRGWVGVLEQVRRGFDDGHPMRFLLHSLAHGLRHAQVRDPALRAALAPRYPLGCRRLIFSNTYYPALARPNVQLDTTPIAAVEPDGLRLADGRGHPLDVLVCATGFDTARPLAGFAVHGLGGRHLDDAWAEGAQAHHGISVAGFPNLFLLLGPNTATGHTSTLLFIEPAVEHVLACMARTEAAGARAIEVRAEAMAAHNAALQARLVGSVWSRCHSWYRAGNGRIVALFPGSAAEYAAAVRVPREHDYRLHDGAA